jgi:hypothetical protein
VEDDMTPDISHYPATKLMGRTVHILPEANNRSCNGCSFDTYQEEDGTTWCKVQNGGDPEDNDSLVCGNKAIVYVLPTKEHMLAYITAKLSE